MSMPIFAIRGFGQVHHDIWTPRYLRMSEWEAAQQRRRFRDGMGTYVYLPARIKARYWISAARTMGRVHVATGRGIHIVSTNRFVPRRIVVQTHCGGAVSYPRAVETPDAAPGFTLCPRCVLAAELPEERR